MLFNKVDKKVSYFCLNFCHYAKSFRTFAFSFVSQTPLTASTYYRQ